MTYTFTLRVIACAFVPVRNGTISPQTDGDLSQQADKVRFAGLFCLFCLSGS
jgi:hypothetical protein